MDARNILVTDYDQCAFTTQGTHPQMLSSGLLNHINAAHYDAFYGCTHRCYSMMPRLKNSAKNKKAGHYSDKDLDANFPTYQITAHIEYATGLPCLAVSTLEDNLRDNCGEGYDQVIKPFESEEITPAAGSYIKFNEVGNYSKSKNLQLTQVALHAQAQYPSTAITLNYIDDNKTLCNKASTVTSEAKWPKNVKLRIFHHVADKDNAPVVSLSGEEKERAFTPRKMERRVTKRPNTLFAKPAVNEVPETRSSRIENKH